MQRCAINGVWATPTTAYTIEWEPNLSPANTHKLVEIADLAGAGLGLSHIIRGRVFRVGTGTDNFPLPIIIDNIDFHYQMDTIGSRQEAAK